MLFFLNAVFIVCVPFPFEPQHDKTNNVAVRPAKTQISLGIRPVWSKDPRFLYADSEDSDQTGRMPRLIWVFAGRTLILLILSCCGSFCVWGRMWNSIVSVPDHCLLIYSTLFALNTAIIYFKIMQIPLKWQLPGLVQFTKTSCQENDDLYKLSAFYQFLYDILWIVYMWITIGGVYNSLPLTVHSHHVLFVKRLQNFQRAITPEKLDDFF